MNIDTLKKAEEFKEGHLNLVQHFLKKGCTFTVEDKYNEDNKFITRSSNYADIKKVMSDDETILTIYDKDKGMISRVWVIPFNGGIDNIADYLVSDEVDEWSDQFEKTMEELDANR